MAWLGGLAMLAACAQIVPDSEVAGRQCPSVIIETPDDLAHVRKCEVIDGDLVFHATALERVTAGDLPILRRVRGSLIAAGAPPLRELTLPALREVGSAPDDILEIGFAADGVERIALPELRVVQGSLGIAALGELRDLDLGALERVTEQFGLINLPQLRELSLPAEIQVGGRAAFELLCHLPISALPDPAMCNAASLSQRELGCCTESAADCSGFACQCD